MRQIEKPPPMLIVMSGLSGSGKTWVSGQLMAALPAVRIRSDIERKRMHHLRETEDSESEVGMGIYAPRSTREVYAFLRDKAGTILDAGHNVILDAAFLEREQRRRAVRLARIRGCPVVLLRIDAPHEVLRERIRARAESAGDASEARLDVLRHQIETADAIAGRETAYTIVADNASGLDVATLVRDIKRLAGGQSGR